MRPYTTVEEINQEWQHIKNENIQDIQLKILAIDNNLECIYFKSWEMMNK